ncbi:hypothetical protein HYPSUDRAFT_206493 [Hypholoma sublateritium FD-334 SS-4]|uniref:MYND-type domain-containing protein n=1 Tax=Hypholoma sublateritium (strain FD-334 SS-4) TaxID=945553 RepID=A0A0D2KQX2_HYPSF|nr:hypothetical protein HYPSUDRAFT_206493 [Hypholoma sublateritium FD-334 SS-4]
MSHHDVSSTPVPTGSRCGNPQCRLAGDFRRCGRCKMRSYCSTACQQLDWSLHRQWCTPSSEASHDERLITKYHAKHRNLYIAFVLEAFDFFTHFHHLDGDNQTAFNRTNVYFLHVLLTRVENPGRGRHNKLEFSAAKVRSVYELGDRRESLQQRLESRFPSILIGYTVFEPLSEVRVTTITMQFEWPPSNIQRPGMDNVLRAIYDSEAALQAAGRA